jgi:hypothetical protein
MERQEVHVAHMLLLRQQLESARANHDPLELDIQERMRRNGTAPRRLRLSSPDDSNSVAGPDTTTIIVV